MAGLLDNAIGVCSAYRAFDADREDALVASAEFIAELTEWGHRRDEQRDLENEQRNIAELEAAITDEQRATWTRERKQRADELAQILRRPHPS